MSVQIHDTAIIEAGVEIGVGTAIWDHVHVRTRARIGTDCIIGEKTYVAYDVEIMDRVKINAQVYICAGVTIERGVMVAAGVLFTNDRFPRATTPDLLELRSSAPDEHTRPTRVREGATIGAGSIIGCDLEIGRFAMVGMGSIVTRSVPDFHLVIGQPASSVAYVCRCGQPFLRIASGGSTTQGTVRCTICGREYLVAGSSVEEMPTAAGEAEAGALSEPGLSSRKLQ